MIRTNRILLSLPLLAGLIAVGCSDDTNGPGTTTLDVPTVYAYESRFAAGESSVAYPGQTVRNLLMQDIRSLASSVGTAGAAPITVDDFLALYEYTDASALSSTTGTGTLPPLESGYSAISTGKNIVGKVAPEMLIGTSTTVDQALRSWFDSVARFSTDDARRGTSMAYTTATGLDLVQLIDKVLLGSVAYYQGTSHYLAGVVDRGNAAPSAAGLPFTEMEHWWDEAFGYFGAARDYGRYSDAALAGSTDDYVFDSNGDGLIDFRSEYNFPFARNAGKRDAGATTSLDMSAEAWEAFRRGRAVISSGGSTDELVVEQLRAARAWEKVVAATVIHYINDVLADMEEITEISTVATLGDLNKHWAEMKGYLWALQFNSLGVVTRSDLTEWHSAVGSTPVYTMPGTAGHLEYRTRLIGVRDALGARVGFDAADVAGW